MPGSLWVTANVNIVLVCTVLLAPSCIAAPVPSARNAEAEDPVQNLLKSQDWEDRFDGRLLLAIRDPHKTGVATFTLILLDNKTLKDELRKQLISQGEDPARTDTLYHGASVSAALQAAHVDHQGVQEILVKYYYGGSEQAVKMDEQKQIGVAVQRLVVGDLQRPQLLIGQPEYLADRTRCRVRSSNTLGGVFETELRLTIVDKVGVWFPVNHRVVALR